jgi:import inner membrane translocase subunit TIM8
MDSPSSSLGGDGNIDLSKLSQKDKQELQQFIVNESQKARIQQCLSPLSTHMCLLSFIRSPIAFIHYQEASRIFLAL